MRCDPKRLWYHGDTSRRLTFEDQRFQNRDNPNALGPGIYFTFSRPQAVGYAGRNGWVYTATIRGKCVTDRQRMTPEEVRRLVGMFDEEGRGYLFSNWDEDPRRAMEKILRAYTTDMDLVSAAADLGRQGGLDFQRDGRTWAAAMSRLGYAALLHRLPEVEHLVVWDPSALTILREEPTTRRRV
jgi:hypothetical protein